MLEFKNSRKNQKSIVRGGGSLTMTKIRTKISRTRDGGFVVVIALIGLLSLTFLLLTGNISTTTSLKISGNYVKTVDAFNIAEAGLARARPMLENQDFDTLLTSYQNTPVINTTSFNGGTYKVTLTNDEKDLSSGGTATNDTNSIVKVLSDGTSASGAKSQITTYIQLVGGSNPVNAPGSPPGGESASVLCGSGTEVHMSGSSSMNGDNYDAPNLPCTGSGCNGTWVSANTYDLIAENTLASCTGGCTSLTQQTSVGSALNCSAWQTLSNQLSALNSSNPNVVVLTGDEWQGDITCATPKIILISTTSATFNLKGNASMCGTIVVASDTKITSSGTVTLEGILLFMGGNSATTGIELDPSGTANIYGKVIFGSGTETNTKKIEMSGSSTVYYSSEAVGYAMQAINNANAGGGSGGTGQLMGVGWEESY